VDPEGVLQRSLRKPNVFVTVAYDSLVKRIVGRMHDRWLRDDIGPFTDLYFVVAIPRFISGERAIAYRAARLLRGGLLERPEPNLKIWVRSYVRWWIGLTHIGEQTPGYDPPDRSCKDPHFTSPSRRLEEDSIGQYRTSQPWLSFVAAECVPGRDHHQCTSSRTRSGVRIAVATAFNAIARPENVPAASLS
jgi:hypothetical protein